LRHRNRRSLGQKAHLPTEACKNHFEGSEKRGWTDYCRRRLLLSLALRLRVGDYQEEEEMELEKTTPKWEEEARKRNLRCVD
jgi:hypothetical protein